MTTQRGPELEAAYAHCREVARREAKNFYWAFRVLPRHKSDAMCAVYAFMRKADDLADDESMPVATRREAMREWTARWRASRQDAKAEPVFLALNDTQQRFGISDELLEQLVAGTTMDLETTPAGTQEVVVEAQGGARTLQVYDSQESLEAYCYLVASVVGLVCIRIFGYSDQRAEEYAVDTGKAFQLTNVLRDVKEDVERGRVYLPATLLAEFGVTPERLLEVTAGAEPGAAEKAMLAALSARAETLYESAQKLVPLLEADARPSMEVLAEIYHRVLRRTAQTPGIVFHERVSVPTAEKLMLLGKGLVKSLAARRAA